LDRLELKRIETEKKKSVMVKRKSEPKEEKITPRASESTLGPPKDSIGRMSVRTGSAVSIGRVSIRPSIDSTPKSARTTVTGIEPAHGRVRSQTPDSIESKSSVDSGVFLMDDGDTDAARRITQKFSMVQQKGIFEVELSDKEKRMRELATQMDLNICDVEDIEREFNRYDEDGSGEIEYPEFRSLLCELLKAKPEDIPERRMTQLWTEIDADKSGCVDFEEFLEWYTKYFFDGGANIGGNPMEQFYAGFGQNRMSTARRQTEGGFEGGPGGQRASIMPS
jgi:hypothetical protein